MKTEIFRNSFFSQVRIFRLWARIYPGCVKVTPTYGTSYEAIILQLIPKILSMITQISSGLIIFNDMVVEKLLAILELRL